MIYSMTGFGKAELQINGLRLSIELRSLNSKSFDFKSRIPYAYQERENEIRERVQKALIRGKIDLNVELEREDAAKGQVIQEEVVLSYLDQLKSIETKSQRNMSQPIEAVLRLPEVIRPPEVKADDQEFESILKGVDEAMERFLEFRQSEGAKLEADLIGQLESIEKATLKVESLKEERIVKRRENLMQKFDEIKVELDQNRLEQEMIYYIEKLDINEELVRLKSHCSYFRETMSKGSAQGRKLGFISQELGREINTLGAKAYHAEIQKIVVGMKDDLEKIKEQSLNIL